MARSRWPLLHVSYWNTLSTVRSWPHFDQQGILGDNQHRFWKRRSYETQLVVTIQEIASRLSKGNQVGIILLDFAKAFDKVSHSRLLYKMEHYGIRNKTSSWINAFLGNRKQEVDGARSSQADVLSDVPQRTVLGPILFLAYINNLPESLRTSDIRLFADDSLLYCLVNKACDNDELHRDLSSLEEWKKWQMSLSVILYITWTVAWGGWQQQVPRSNCCRRLILVKAHLGYSYQGHPFSGLPTEELQRLLQSN